MPAAHVSASVSASQPALRSCCLVEIQRLSLALRQFGHCRLLLGGCRCHLGLEFGEMLLKSLLFLLKLLFGFSRQF